MDSDDNLVPSGRTLCKSYRCRLKIFPHTPSLLRNERLALQRVNPRLDLQVAPLKLVDILYYPNSFIRASITRQTCIVDKGEHLTPLIGPWKMQFSR
jgi:hypothetical protein